MGPSLWGTGERDNASTNTVCLEFVEFHTIRVATVINYFKKWMEKWPSITSLAQSTQEVHIYHYLFNTTGSKRSVGRIRLL